MKFFLTVSVLFFTQKMIAQDQDTLRRSFLEAVVVSAFEQPRKLKDVAAAVSFIGPQTLNRFAPTSVVQAINTSAGVRMEERSPGSYRLNIRGSSLRSPFGVRNVKIYYNDLPFTDPGGQSYLNALGYYNFQTVEIIKGPGSSVYGAGTGGAMLIESLNPNEAANASVEYTAGSFGLQNAYASLNTATETSQNKIGFQYQKSDGYRNHSALNRKILTWTGRHSTERTVLKTTLLYSRLFYQTPGALTLAEFTANPKAARPAGSGFPGAEQNRAAIDQTLFLAGVSLRQQFSPAFSNTTSAYGQYTEFANPAVRNYGKNREPHVGGRTSFAYEQPLSNGLFRLTAGAEMQQGFSSVSVFGNRSGTSDTLQTEDEIPVRQSLIFLQTAVEKRGWELTAGASLNSLNLRFTRTYPGTGQSLRRRFSNELAPRVSLAKKWRGLTVYSSLSEGFSPPTSAELFPSGSNPNPNLDAEQGINLDLGFRGTAGGFSFDVNAFYFRLRNTLAPRRDAGGGDFYVNAGRTKQSGIETAVNYLLYQPNAFLRRHFFWVSHTWHRFRYAAFTQLTTDYSGNRLPGVAPHTVSTGWDAEANGGFSAALTYFFSDRQPLNDANTEYANAYHLVFAKFGFETRIGSAWQGKLTAGVENLLDQRYSLGNDVNAFGGRYYNAAPGRSLFVSLAVRVFTAKNKL